MIDFIRYGEFWFCEFYFLRYFYVVGIAAGMNPFILSKSGFVKKKLGKIIACTCMEYTFGGNLPGGDPQSKSLNRKDSNIVYCFETRF